MLSALAAAALAAPSGALAADAVGGVLEPHEVTLRASTPPAATSVIVTHHRLRFDLVSLGVTPSRVDVALTDLLGTPAASAAAVPRLDHWSTATVDTTALCGMSLDLGWSLAGAGEDDEPVLVDAVRFGDGVCPQFVDADADGRCPQGQDFDHDGECTSAGEVFEEGARLDCNDTARGPACIGLAVVDEDGSTLLVATGAPAGELVWFFGSTRRGQSCPPTLGGVCVDLAMPRMLGSAEVAEDGAAHLATAGPPSGFYQAGVLRLGMDSDFSAAVAATGQPTVPQPATEP